MDFLTEFQKLLLEKPRYNLKGVNAENCDYADTAVNSRDCYYSFGTFHCDQLLYGRYSRNCIDSSDLTFCFDCEWCYECIGCSKSYGLNYSKYSTNCIDSWFLENCSGCRNCFGCMNLHQKEYWMFNQKLTKEAYEKRLSELNLGNPEQIRLIKERVAVLRTAMPQVATQQTMTEESIGDNLTQAKGAYMCFDAYDLEDCGYCIETNSLKDCYDMTVCFKTEASYQCMHCPGDYNCNFCYHCDYCNDSEFCAYSKNLKNCFGCVYLMNKEYHILNEPYSPEDYEKKVAEIKKELMEAGMYNLKPYFISDYERQRLKNETDPAIPSAIPMLNSLIFNHHDRY